MPSLHLGTVGFGMKSAAITAALIGVAGAGYLAGPGHSAADRSNAGAIGITATPGAVTLAPGATAGYALTLTRTNLTGPIFLSLQGKLPSGASGAVSPDPVTGSSAKLQVRTGPTTPDGSYPLTVLATGTDRAGHRQSATRTVQLIVHTPAKAFGISGNLAGQLSPGAVIPLDLTLTNPNRKQLSVTNLTVSVVKVTRTAKAVAANAPCGTGDYAIVQYSGRYPLTLAGSSSARLSRLGATSAALPRVVMRDTPVNQDGCKGATVTLGYTGAGQGS